MEFLHWLIGMGLLFYGWMIPIGIGCNFIFQKGKIFIGILICLTAIPIEILLYHLDKKFESEEEKKKKELRQALEQERIKTENERRERIKPELFTII